MSTQQTPVAQLPWYDTLRKVMAPYDPAGGAKADTHFTSAEIISAIERHHGVPQGPVGKELTLYVYYEDFVRAMRHIGFREENAGGLELHWPVKKKPVSS